MINILLVEDHELYRMGLSMLLNNAEGIKLIAEASDGLEGVKKARELNDSLQNKISKFYEKMSDLGIDLDFEDLEKTYRESIDSGVLSAAEALDEVVIQPISKMLCDALCFVVVFLLSVLTLNLLKLVLELVFKLPLLKGMNKTSGAVVGVLFGVLKVFAFCTNDTTHKQPTRYAYIS